MTMVPRDTITESQIKQARVMPGPAADQDDDTRAPDSELVNEAERPSKGTPAAPSRLPGYK